MGESLARFLSVSMPRDLIVSCMAISPGTLRMLAARPGQKPAIIEWMPAGYRPGHHPDWRPDAHALRNSSGQLLPGLLRQFPVLGQAMPERIAVFGFSAGSNSGVRELLRHSADRERISFVGSIDGLHLMTSGGQIAAPADLDPWVQYAQRAVSSSRPASTMRASIVFTGNNLAAPTRSTTTTPEAMKLINRRVLDYFGGRNIRERYPTRMQLIREFASRPPIPNGMGGIGNCYFFEYPGRSPQDHIIQARIIVPRVMDTFLADAWGARPGMEA